MFEKREIIIIISSLAVVNWRVYMWRMACVMCLVSFCEGEFQSDLLQTNNSS